MFKIAEVRQGLEEEREGVVIRNNRVSFHVGVYRKRGVRDVGMREGSDQSVANENTPRDEGESGVQLA